MRDSGLRKPLKRPLFRRLLATYAINEMGDWMGIVALSVLVYEATGSPYAVTVLTQPTSPAQSCFVSYGTGTAGTTNVTNVSVICRTIGQFAYTANNGSGNVSGFAISPATGVLTPIPGNPVAVGEADQEVNHRPFKVFHRGKVEYVGEKRSGQRGIFTDSPEKVLDLASAFKYGRCQDQPGLYQGIGLRLFHPDH